MSINLGNKAYAALRELRGSPAFVELMEALGDTSIDLVNKAMRSAPGDAVLRLHATSYATAVQDLWVAMHAAATGVSPQQVRPPRTPTRIGRPPAQSDDAGQMLSELNNA